MLTLGSRNSEARGGTGEVSAADDRAAGPAGVDWRPGHQTAEELREEWYRTHGWVSTPSRETIAEWAAVQRAEDAYVARQSASDRVDAGSNDSDASAPEAPEPLPETIHVEFLSQVFLPCAEALTELTPAGVDMRYTRDGRTALLVYSSLAALRQCCGDDQAWMSMPRSGITKLREARPFELLMLDVPIPIELRRGKQ